MYDTQYYKYVVLYGMYGTNGTHYQYSMIVSITPQRQYRYQVLL